MTWFKVDDGFADHPKVIRLQQEKCWKGALALWTLAGSWSSRHLTDGRVPAIVVQRLGGTEQEARALVAAGLWSAEDGDYTFHDWTAQNPSRETVEAKREAQRQRVAKHREKRDGNALHDHHVTQQVTPPPSRPVPTRPVPLPTVVSGAAAPDSRVDEMKRARALLTGGYEKRYRTNPGGEGGWMSAAASYEEIGIVAAWCASDGDLEQRVNDVLDGAFADDWMSGRDPKCKGHPRWPWKSIAKDPNRYADAARETREKAARVARAAEVEREREREERRRDREAQEDAIQPGDLKAMLAGFAAPVDDEPDEKRRERIQARQQLLQAQARKVAGE